MPKAILIVAMLLIRTTNTMGGLLNLFAGGPGGTESNVEKVPLVEVSNCKDKANNSISLRSKSNSAGYVYLMVEKPFDFDMETASTCSITYDLKGFYDHDLTIDGETIGIYSTLSDKFKKCNIKAIGGFTAGNKVVITLPPKERGNPNGIVVYQCIFEKLIDFDQRLRERLVLV